MNAHGELRESLQATAKRSVGLVPACNNEASIRLYLVLPMIGLLGYDSSDPLEVYPNHEADAVAGKIHRADFAILSAGNPVIAFATARSASEMASKRNELAHYFNAWSSAKLGVVTNGILYEFYVDAASPGQMDDQPFLTLDLETAAQSGVTDEVLEALVYATKGAFDPDMIAEKAHLQLVRKRLRTAFIEEAQSPSAELCRVMLNQIGFSNVRKDAIERHYAPLVKTAFEEALVLPVVAKLRSGAAADGKAAVNLHVGPKIASAERELAIFNYVRRRLAFLVKDEVAFAAIDRIGFKDYVGKLVVYYDREPKGRIFELIRGSDGFDKFIFPEPFGEIITNTITTIDEPLKATFTARVRELDNGALAAQRQLRLA
jgi:predicted type IV restriction endonuclease